MNIKKSRLIEIIKEEMKKLSSVRSDFHPQTLQSPSQSMSTPTPEVEPEPQSVDPTIQDLMFKMEKLMTRVAKLESMLKVKPSETDAGGDTVVGPLADLEETNNA